MTIPHAVIIGVGDGLSAAVARELAPDHELTLAARSGAKMQAVAAETGARTVLLPDFLCEREPIMPQCWKPTFK